MNSKILNVLTIIWVASILIATNNVYAQVGIANENIGVASGNLSLISTNALNGTPSNSNLDNTTAFDGLLNSNGTNGAVFDLSQIPFSTWNVNLVDVVSLTSLDLYQRVGGSTDNGIEDFSVTFYSGENQTGSVLHSQSFSADLNVTSSFETFALSAPVVNPESFSLVVDSSFGNPVLAEFSEVTFSGATAVPEPSSAVLGMLAMAFAACKRRRSLVAARSL